MTTATPREIFLDARGLRFRALEWPQPGLPTLLLHATSFCAEVWGPAWEAARAHGAGGFRALAVDARGHGGSAAPAAPDAYAWTCLAEDAAALSELVARGVPPAAPQDGAGARAARRDAAGAVVLVGHSSGATAALAAAARRPDRVRALVLVEPVLFDPPQAAAADSFAGSRALAERARRRRHAWASREQAREALRARFPFSGFAAGVLDAFLAGGLHPAPGGGVELRCAPEIEAACYDGAAALDLRPLLAAVRAPTLLVAGEHTAIPPAQLARLRAALPGLEQVSIPGTTHFAALERPEQVGAAIAGFLARAASNAPGR